MRRVVKKRKEKVEKRANHTGEYLRKRAEGYLVELFHTLAHGTKKHNYVGLTSD